MTALVLVKRDLRETIDCYGFTFAVFRCSSSLIAYFLYSRLGSLLYFLNIAMALYFSFFCQPHFLFAEHS